MACVKREHPPASSKRRKLNWESFVGRKSLQMHSNYHTRQTPSESRDSVMAHKMQHRSATSRSAASVEIEHHPHGSFMATTSTSTGSNRGPRQRQDVTASNKTVTRAASDPRCISYAADDFTSRSRPDLRPVSESPLDQAQADSSSTSSRRPQQLQQAPVMIDRREAFKQFKQQRTSTTSSGASGSGNSDENLASTSRLEMNLAAFNSLPRIGRIKRTSSKKQREGLLSDRKLHAEKLHADSEILSDRKLRVDGESKASSSPSRQQHIALSHRDVASSLDRGHLRQEAPSVALSRNQNPRDYSQQGRGQGQGQIQSSNNTSDRRNGEDDQPFEHGQFRHEHYLRDEEVYPPQNQSRHCEDQYYTPQQELQQQHRHERARQSRSEQYHQDRGQSQQSSTNMIIQQQREREREPYHPNEQCQPQQPHRMQEPPITSTNQRHLAEQTQSKSHSVRSQRPSHPVAEITTNAELPSAKSLIAMLTAMVKEVSAEQEKDPNRALPMYPIPSEVLRVIRMLQGNHKCVDCGSTDGDIQLSWASVTYGSLLCQACAFRHVTKCDEVRHESHLYEFGI